jgi:hypothetical protein
VLCCCCAAVVLCCQPGKLVSENGAKLDVLLTSLTMCCYALCCAAVVLRHAVLCWQPGKLVSDNDAKPDVLAQLEAAFRAAPAPGGDSKGARKAK